MTGETFKGSCIGQMNDGTAIVYDFGFVDLAGGSFHFDMGIAAGDLQTLFQGPINMCLPVTYTFKKWRFACVGGTHVGEIGYVVVDPPVQGSLIVGDGDLPYEMCIALRRATGFASRRDRGRIFFGPVNSQYRDTSANESNVFPDANLVALSALLKHTLTTQAHVLQPVILAADGSYSGRTIVNTSIGQQFVHRRSRRPRVGV